MMWNPRVILALVCLWGYWSMADYLELAVDGPSLLFARFGLVMISAGVFWYMVEKRGW